MGLLPLPLKLENPSVAFLTSLIDTLWFHYGACALCENAAEGVIQSFGLELINPASARGLPHALLGFAIRRSLVDEAGVYRNRPIAESVLVKAVSNATILVYPIGIVKVYLAGGLGY